MNHAISLTGNTMSVYDITEFGAVSKGRICTEAIQRAIDEAERHGGGRVVVPAGEFLTGAHGQQACQEIRRRRSVLTWGGRRDEVR